MNLLRSHAHRRPHGFGFRVAALVTIVSFFAFSVAGVSAQDVPDSGPAVEDAEPVLDGVTGEPELYEEFLEWRRVREADPTPARKLVLDGEIRDDLLEATASFVIETSADGEVVALGLPEAVITEIIDADGGSGGRFERFEEDVGYFWRFDEAGPHTVRVKALVPIEGRAGARRVVLSVPENVPATLATIDFGERVVDVVGGGRSVVTTVAADDGSVRSAKAYGISPRLDLSWAVAPPPADDAARLRVTTDIVAAVDPAGVRVTATQRVQSLSGRFSEFTTTLPPGFDIVDVSGRDYLSHRLDVEAGGGEPLVTIELVEPTVGPIEINWSLSHTDGADLKPFQLSGFAVSEASRREQRGTLAVTATNEFSLAMPARQAIAVRRSESTVQTEDPLIAAYGFRRQPFRVAVRPTRLEPLATVEPRQTIIIEPTRATVDLAFQVEPLRGAVERLTFAWTDAGAWTFVPVNDADLTVSRLSAGDDGRVEIVLSKPVRTGSELKLRATRAFADATFDLPVAVPQGYFALPPSLTARHGSSLDVSFEDVATRSAVGDVDGTDEIRDGVVRRLLPAATETDIRCFVRARESVVRATEEISVSPVEDRWTVSQRIGLVSSSGDAVERLRLAVPAGVEASDVVILESGMRAVVTELVGGDAAGEIRVESLAGSLGANSEIELAWSVAFTGEEAERSVSLFRPLDVERLGTTFRRADGAADQAWVPAAGVWRRIDGEYETRWESEGAIDSVALSRDDESAANRSLVVDRVLVRTWVDAGSRRNGRFDAAIKSLPARLTVKLPPEMRLSGYGFESGQRVDVADDASSSGTVELFVPKKSVGRDRLVTLWYELAGEPVSAVRELSLSAPRLVEAGVVGETVWQVIAPDHLLLVDHGPAWTPRYLWAPTPLGFTRQSDLNPLDWIGLESPDRELSPYVFSKFGSTQTLTVRLASRTAVFTLGAGVAAVLAFVAFGGARRVWAMSACLFLAAVACCGLWAPAAVAVFVQPAAIGFLVVAVASWADRPGRHATDEDVRFEDDFELDEFVGELAADPTQIPQTIDLESDVHASPSEETFRPADADVAGTQS